MSTLSGHLTRLGSALATTTTRFNETVGSYERSVLTAARRFDELGIAETAVPTPEPVEATVRSLRPAEPASGEPPLDDATVDVLSFDSDRPQSRDGTTG